MEAKNVNKAAKMVKKRYKHPFGLFTIMVYPDLNALVKKHVPWLTWHLVHTPPEGGKSCHL
ncbi:MAG: hypothetical protein Q7S19_00350 [bacterium]|nr:hypothetical protein [bacterium]